MGTDLWSHITSIIKGLGRCYLCNDQISGEVVSNSICDARSAPKVFKGIASIYELKQELRVAGHAADRIYQYL